MPDRSHAKSHTCPQTILDLIERFELHAETYRLQTYNETQVRREFIDPFFKALGWDVDNESGHAEAYKDVIHEDAIKVGGSTKAPDYCFRIGGARKFFVEAKKPSVSVGDDPGPAYQLRRYAWTNKLPLSIVTDFEELAVYDCRIKPKPDDKPSTARVLYLKCDEYPKRWDEIASIFSKDAILKGSFDKYAESNKRKRGTAEVDDEFLKEIESWRDELARSIALRNPNLSVRDLNYAVGKTIDRIIFLRMCEDRGVETYAQLRLLLNGPRVYPRLLDIFYKADQRYNSGLFHFEPEKNRPDPPDTLTPNLTIDDAVLKDILKNLYYPQCPYEFSVMPPEILGQVYEQFLGKVVTLTVGHRAKIEYKPEVKKAGGVYYTPKYIVDYIVEHTVGKLLEGKTPADIGPILDSNPNPKRQRGANPTRERKRPVSSPLHILDPACGSGSFLLGAYETLLRWHLQWYSQNGPEKWARKKAPPIFQSTIGNRKSTIGNWRLTITEKKRILLNNIFGVDIDPQAVEVTKLSLLLKVLEGESQQTLDNQLRLFHERALPDLGGNIKCGNSLIGPDFYENQQLELLDDEERYRINVFDWQAEFPQVFQSRAHLQSRARKEAESSHRARKEADSPSHDDEKAPLPHGRGSDQNAPNGGFDAVIGNPPYIRMEAFKQLKDYLRSRYRVHDERSDLYVYFIEREHELLGDGGMFGMIVSNKFIRANYGRKVRKRLAEVATVRRIVDFAGLPVFPGATVRTIVLITSKGRSDYEAIYSPPPHPKQFIALSGGSATVKDVADPIAYELPQAALSVDGWRLVDQQQASLVSRLASEGVRLDQWLPVPICYGVKSGLVEAFVVAGDTATKLRSSSQSARDTVRPYVTGRDVRRYARITSERMLIYTHHGIDLGKSEAILEHLRPFKAKLLKRATTQKWYELQQPQERYVDLMAQAKLVYPDIASECRFTLDTDGYICGDTTFAIPVNDLMILGVLNSRLALFYFKSRCAALEGATDSYLRFKLQYVAAFPIPHILNSTLADRIHLGAQEMLRLHKQLAAAKSPSDQTAIQRQIDATDRQIDQLVYELYGLTEDDVSIVEHACGK